jgi:ribosome maturation factor RimP
MEYVTEEGERILRVMIEHDRPITLDDCVLVSERLNAMLDEDDPFEEAYHLEVTSAGAEHELRNAEEIQRHIGELVHVKTFDQQFTGHLHAYQEGRITIRFSDNTQTVIDELDVQLLRLTIQ